MAIPLSGNPFQNRYPWLNIATLLLLVATIIACFCGVWGMGQFFKYAIMHQMSQMQGDNSQMDLSLFWEALRSLGLALLFMVVRDLLQALVDIAENSFPVLRPNASEIQQPAPQP